MFLEERASFSPDALTGMEANLRFAGPETMESKIFARLTAWQNWIFQRPNAVGEDGALQPLRHRPEAGVRHDEGVAAAAHGESTASHREGLDFGCSIDCIALDHAAQRRMAQKAGRCDGHHERRLLDKIPNNVNLTEDRRVLKALEGWHPGYIDWWNDMGPEGFQESLVYLRTAVSVDPKGWAKFDYVKMPEYRWGILLAPAGRGPQHPVRRASTASRPGRKCRANTAPCCAA